MKKYIISTFLLLSFLTNSLNISFAGVWYQWDPETQFTWEKYENLTSKCEEISQDVFERFKQTLSYKTTVIIDWKPVPWDLWTYDTYVKDSDKQKLDITTWMSRIIWDNNNYVYAYLYNMVDVINLFWKDRFNNYLISKYNEDTTRDLNITAWIKDWCGFSYTLKSSTPILWWTKYKKTILSNDGKNPLAEYDKMYLSAMEDWIFWNIAYFNLSAVDSFDIWYLDINKPTSNIKMFINYNNKQITFWNISSKLSSLTISTKDWKSIVKIYKYSDANKTQTLSDEDFKSLINQPLIITINWEKQKAGDLINDKTILSKYDNKEENNQETNVSTWDESDISILDDAFKDITLIDWSQPLPEKQEKVVQNFVSKINTKWDKVRLNILKQLENIKNKIPQNKLDIYNRLVYLLSWNQ